MNTGPTVTGFDELLKAMDDLSKEITTGRTARIWKNSMRYAMEPVKDTARILIQSQTKGTGTLADSLYIAVHKPTARDKRSGSYMGETYMARVGVTSKRPESKINTTVYATKKGQTKSKDYLAGKTNRPVAIAVEFGTADVSSRPFLRPALTSNIQYIQNRLGDALWRELTFGKYAQEAGLNFAGKI